MKKSISNLFTFSSNTDQQNTEKTDKQNTEKTDKQNRIDKTPCLKTYSKLSKHGIFNKIFKNDGKLTMKLEFIEKKKEHL